MVVNIIRPRPKSRDELTKTLPFGYPNYDNKKTLTDINSNKNKK